MKLSSLFSSSASLWAVVQGKATGKTNLRRHLEAGDNEKTITVFQNAALAFSPPPNPSKDRINTAKLTLYKESTYETDVGKSVTTCINTGNPQTYTLAQGVAITLNEQAMCTGQITYTGDEGEGTLILSGIIDAFVDADTAIVGGTGDFAGARGVASGTPTGATTFTFTVTP